MKKNLDTKRRDKKSLAGLLALKQLLIIPLSVFGLILTGANFAVPTTF